MKNYGKIMKIAIYVGVVFAILGIVATAVCALLHYTRLVYLRPYMPMTFTTFFGGVIIALLGLIGKKSDDKSKTCDESKDDEDVVKF